VDIVKAKDSASRFFKFSRPPPVTSTDRRGSEYDGADRRILSASDARIQVWQLRPLQQCAEIENIESGATHVDFGGDQNEVIVFHAWNTKLTVFGLDTGRSQVIKTPKSSHPNSFGYRPRTSQFAVLLKPDTSDLLTIHEFRTYELINRAVLPTLDAQGLKWSPDGRWIAVWDAASTGTKVLILTAHGQLFRTYSGPPDTDPVLDLGVKGIEWSPADRTGTSELLAVAKVDGNVDILKSKTVRASP
jgi:WD40 repeat protein